MFFACSEDNPTEPKIEYPISFNSYAKELAEKMNERRVEYNEQKFTYIENVEIDYYGQIYNFVEATNNYKEPFSNQYEIEFRRNETDIIIVTRHEFYLENLNNIVGSIMNYDMALPAWHWNFYNRQGFNETVSINIIEIGNNYPKTNEFGEAYEQFGKHRIVVYIYNAAKYANQI